MKHLDLLMLSHLKLELSYYIDWGWSVELYGNGDEEGVCVGVGRAENLDEACRVAIDDHRMLRSESDV